MKVTEIATELTCVCNGFVVKDLSTGKHYITDLYTNDGMYYTNQMNEITEEQYLNDRKFNPKSLPKIRFTFPA